MTNQPCVIDKQGKLLTGRTPKKIDDLVHKGVISGGMIPKIGSALDAARNGVKSVHIIHGRVPHALLLEVLTDEGVGTLIRSKKCALQSYPRRGGSRRSASHNPGTPRTLTPSPAYP